MLKKIDLLYKNFNDTLYNEICDKFGLSKEHSKTGNNEWLCDDDNNPLRKVNCFNLFYNIENWGRIWWIVVSVDLSLLYGIDNNLPVPSSKLFDLESRIENLFENNIGISFKDHLPDIIGNDLIDKRISYLKYVVHINDVNAEVLMNKLKKCNFVKEQLDMNYFDTFFVRNSTPAFTVNKLDNNTVRLCVKCRETAIKSIYKKYAQPYVSVPTSVILDKENAADTIYKQIIKYTKPNLINELNRDVILNKL